MQRVGPFRAHNYIVPEFTKSFLDEFSGILVIFGYENAHFGFGSTGSGMCPSFDSYRAPYLVQRLVRPIQIPNVLCGNESVFKLRADV